jgi:tRNA threonylcarbamoyladenosine biosynthesis protein TsaB
LTASRRLAYADGRSPKVGKKKNRVSATPSLRLLILETSGRTARVALAEGPHLRGVRCLEEARRHARDLAPAVAALLAEQPWRPRDLHGVIVSRGPGSYTGLRVGVMSAKALAYATGCALIAVETFAAIALQAPEEAGRVDVLADAQQDRIYVQPFGRNPDGWHTLAPLAIRPASEWLADRDATAGVTGPGTRIVEGRLPAGTLVVEPEWREPRPESLLRLGLARYEAGERDDPWALEPLYLRPSSAEEQWQQRKDEGGKG